jgi:transketolase
MPCAEVFLAQDAVYRESVLPAAARRRLAIEAGVSAYWRAFVGLDGEVIGVDRFGESAPASAVFEYLGFTVDAIVARAETLLA